MSALLRESNALTNRVQRSACADGRERLQRQRVGEFWVELEKGASGEGVEHVIPA